MKHVTISSFAKEEKPVERMYEYGPQVLSDAELLAVILRTGTSKQNVVELSQMILQAHPNVKGIASLPYFSMQELMELSGVGIVKASQILALAEISKRISRQNAKEHMRFNSPESIADYFMEDVRYLAQEKTFAPFLDSSNSIIYQKQLAEGSIRKCFMEPREIFLQALKWNAVSIIILHNHPSGYPEPSEADRRITERIEKLGNELGIHLLDHIILGNKRYFSFKERGLLGEVR